MSKRTILSNIARKVARPYAKEIIAQDFTELYRPSDFPSVRESLERHSNILKQGKDVKGFFTSDHQTIQVAHSILRELRRARSYVNHQENITNFFEENIFSQPIHSTQETGSVKVLISDIGDFARYKREYEANKNRKVMICVGGPGAEDQSVLASLITGIRDRLDDIVYMTRDYKESNVNHAAKQSHARHGNALNADRTLTGHAILPIIILRNLIGVTPEEALDPDYTKIDVKFTIDPKKLRIYLGNELNYIIQSYREINGQITEHDINRLESVFSQEVLRVVEKITGMEISGGIERSLVDSSSIHVSFSEKNAREVEHENEQFRRVGIKSEILDPEEIDLIFGEEGRKNIHSAWRYPGDSHIKFDAHQKNRNFIQENGATWIDGVQIERIFVTRNDQGKSKFAGVLTKDGKYHYGSQMHATLGYKAEYIFDPESEARRITSKPRRYLNYLEDIFGLQPPLTSKITTATGVSVNAIFKKSDRMKAVIERFGSTGEIAVTNSHWTMIAQNDDYVVMRITGGGNTGSEEYNPAYFINVIANTRRIFGDDLVGILSTYGCPRSVNARNSTEFAKLAEGLLVSYGKGGTGNTKRHAEAITGLMMLGFDSEVVEYFNKFKDRNGLALGDRATEIHQHLLDVKFIHDNTERTNRRMGYDTSISLEEAIAISLILATSSLVLKKLLEEKKKENEQENDTETKKDLERPSAITKTKTTTTLLDRSNSLSSRSNSA
jgi:hypothetical protein